MESFNADWVTISFLRMSSGMHAAPETLQTREFASIVSSQPGHFVIIEVV